MEEKRFVMRFTRIELILIQQLIWKILQDPNINRDDTKEMLRKIDNRINRRTALTMYTKEKFPLEYTVLEELSEKLGIQLWR